MREITYKWFVENDYVSADFIKESLGNNEAVYLELLESEYIKKNKNYELAFEFVGIISLAQQLICVLPKYYKPDFFTDFETDKKKISELVQIIKVLRKSEKDNDQISDYDKKRDPSSMSELVLADKFIRDYLEYGIFRKDNHTHSLNKDGETNWNTTIELVDPVFSRGKPIYAETYAHSILDDENNAIVEFHKWLIKYFLLKYGQILDYKFVLIEDTINNYNDLGTDSQIENLILKELNYSFTDRKIALLKNMLLFIKKNSESNDKRYFSLYGTGAFHTIWEKACGVIFGNELSEYHPNRYNYINKIPAPIWKDANLNSSKKEKFRLDIISTSNDGESLFFIFDAKYYNITFNIYPNNELRVAENPGVGDVGKQLLYALAFKDEPYRFKFNCLLFPKRQNELFKVFGFVSFDRGLFSPCLDSDKVYCIYLSPALVYSGYLNNKTTGQLSLNLIADAISGFPI